MNATGPSYAIQNNVDKHRFEADLGDGSRAVAQYRLSGRTIIFTHTEVPPPHAGQGVGTALIRFALNFARESGFKIVPVCPFFAAYIERHPEEQDLLA